MDESKFSKSDKVEIYVSNAKENGLPKDAYLQVTEACNCKCKMCDIWKIPKPQSGKTETLVQIVKTLSEAKFNWVTLWGGEPYMHPDIIKIMEEVKMQGMKLQLITNGTLLRNDPKGAKLDATAELADNVVYSIDAPTAEIHDLIRGVRGTFSRAVASIKALSEKVASQGKGPGIEIDTTILKDNIQHLPQMIDFSKQFGDVLVDYDPAQTQGTGNSEESVVAGMDEAMIKAIFEKLVSAANHQAKISSAPKLKEMEKYLKGEPLNGPCMSLFKDLLINHEGKVYFCWGWGKIIGNILDANFKQQWERAIAENREAIDGCMDRCKKCGFSHVRWPDPDVAGAIAEANEIRKGHLLK